MEGTDSGRDPLVQAGLLLLFLLSAATVALYRSAPQSVADASSRAWVAARPDVFGSRMARGRERLRAATLLLQQGDSAGATRGFLEAAQHGWEARTLASEPVQASEATELWADALLQRAAVFLAAGTGPWWRRDDDEVLQMALAAVQEVLTVPTRAETRTRAEQMRTSIERQLRTGPLEWLPGRR